jgi:hypothetical protein
MKSIASFIFISFWLFWASTAHAQGNDFPFSPGVPSWGQPQLPSPVPGFDYSYGYAPGGEPRQLQNRRGDTIVMDYVLDWWGLGPLSTSVMSNAGNDMRWTGPDDRAGQWSHSPLGFWCLRCEWRFQAGDDNVWIWIDYTGSSQFGAHLEVKEIIPAPEPAKPWFSVLTDPDKQTADNISLFFSAFTGVMYGAAAGFGADWRLAGILGVLGYAGDKFANHFYQIARDPWDGDYCSEAQFVYPQLTDIEWLRGYDPSGALVDSIEVIDGYGNQAYTAANRALSAASVGAWDCAWVRRYEAIWALNRMGDWMWVFRWGLEVNSNTYANSGYDMRVLDEQLWNLGFTASWLQWIQS